jgi:hypothetical protein
VLRRSPLRQHPTHQTLRTISVLPGPAARHTNTAPGGPAAPAPALVTVQVTHHASRFTLHASRFTHHGSSSSREHPASGISFVKLIETTSLRAQHDQTLPVLPLSSNRKKTINKRSAQGKWYPSNKNPPLQSKNNRPPQKADLVVQQSSS